MSPLFSAPRVLMVSGLVALGCNSTLRGATADAQARSTIDADVTSNDGAVIPSDAPGGSNDAAIDATPVVAAEGLSYVGTGEYTSYYLKDGVVYGQGTYSGILGFGNANGGVAYTPTPITVTPSDLKFVSVQGGLHQSIAADVNGNVWTWGNNDVGQRGLGTVDPSADAAAALPTMIPNFGNVVFVTASSECDAALTSDGKLFVWGQLQGGVAGDNDNDGVQSTPLQVPFPDGVAITKVKIADDNVPEIGMVIALDSDGNVWSWGSNTAYYWDPPAGYEPDLNPYLGRGGNILVPAKISFPQGAAPIIDIAAAHLSTASFALDRNGVVYGWGRSVDYIGRGVTTNSDGTTSQYLPVAVPLPKPAVAIACSDASTHVILNDGTQWAWGSNDNGGQVGNGGTETFASPGVAPWGAGHLDMVLTPVQIGPSNVTFTKMWGNNSDAFYFYAQDSTGQLYSCGRNKTDNLGNGVSGGTWASAAVYPNSWDVMTLTAVDPFTAVEVDVPAPYCVQNPTADGCP